MLEITKVKKLLTKRSDFENCVLSASFTIDNIFMHYASCIVLCLKTLFL